MKKKPYTEFVGVDSAPLYLESTGPKAEAHLLWGDGVRPLESVKNGRVEVRARGKTGWVDKNALGGKSLLEIYFIDVGGSMHLT